MEFTILDKSKYLKGLLIISKKDKSLSHIEKEYIREAGSKLGFARDFYEEALENLLQNEHIKEDTLVFSSKEIAKVFLHDGIKLSLSDGSNYTDELKWLQEVARANSISGEWFNKSLEFHKSISNQNKAAEEKIIE